VAIEESVADSALQGPWSGTFSFFSRSRGALSEGWDMDFLDHPWFTLGVLLGIALFATVSALTVQIFFGRHIGSVLVGPVIAISGVLAFCYLQRNAGHKPK